MRRVQAILFAESIGLSSPPAGAHADDMIKMGVMSDFNSVYSDYSGKSSLVAAELAVEDFGGKLRGKRIELVSADFKNKTDVALGIARRWFDQNINVIIDAPNSSAAVALGNLVTERDKVYLLGAVSSDLTGKFCTPNRIQFTVDTYSQATIAARELVKRGMETWFFLTVDYTLGHMLERDATAVLKPLDAKSLGPRVLQGRSLS